MSPTAPGRNDAARRALAVLAAVNLLNYVDRFVVAAVLEPMGRDLKLTDAQLGRFPFVFLVVYMIAAPIFGALAEQRSRTRLAALGVLIFSGCTALAAGAASYGQLLLTRGLVGVGEASYAALAPAILSDLFAESERAKRFTWFYLAIPVGSALGYALGGGAAQLWGWRAAFFVVGLPGAFVAFLLWRLPDPPRGAMDGGDPAAGLSLRARLSMVLGNRAWRACTACYVGYTFAMGALAHWAPTLLQRRFGVSTGEAGLVFGGLAVATGILGTLAGGAITDRWQRRFPDAGIALSAGTLLLAAPVVVAGLKVGSYGAALALFFLGMLLLFVNTSPVNALTVSVLPAGARALGAAVNVLLIHLLGDALSPQLVGLRSETAGGGADGLASALLVTVPAIVAAAAALWWARGGRRVGLE